MATLPMDIIFSCILPKVHAKSLLRFKCVSRSFLTEISSSKFIKLQHRNALSSNDNRLFILQGDDWPRLHICDLDSPHTPLSIVHYPNRIVASCESYFVGAAFNNSDDLILVNPSTRTYRELPPVGVSQNAHGPSIVATKYGMCHCLDEFNDDYKVAKFVDFQDDVKRYFREVVVYSLRTNSWKLVECEPTDGIVISWRHGTPALVQNHLLHMILTNALDSPKFRMTRIGCFDIKAEKWANDVLFPDILLGDHRSFKLEYWPYLGVLDGKLCYLDPVVRKATCDLWVMKDYGVKESWVKLMSVAIRSDTFSPWHWHGVYHPVASRKGSPHELLCRQGRTCQFFWYNLRNNQVTKAKIDIGPRVIYSSSFICKGSLLNFPGSQHIGSLHLLNPKE